jgi:hypothetical protein
MAGDYDFLKNYTKPPEEGVADTTNTGTGGTPSTTETQTQTSTETGTQAQQTDTGAVAGATTTETPDKFFDELNKRFSTSFKGDDELKNIFGMPNKISELEGKAKLADDYSKKIEDYEKQLGEYKNNGNSELLSKPLLRKAYIADQLLAKYPDKDPFTLQEIVMADVSKMSDIDVLVKAQKINHPNIAENDLRAAIYKKNGIDLDTKPEDWDSVTRAELAMSADDARANIKQLTNGIELPKAVTKEEREAQEHQAMQKRVELSTPLKAEFLQFDKLKVGDIDYDVPADYKSKLEDTFNAMFIQNGMEPTKENLQTAKELRDMTCLYQNIDKIIEIAVKKGQVEVQKKLDEALHNNQPPNTATASDDGDQGQILPGLAQFLEKNR